MVHLPEKMSGPRIAVLQLSVLSVALCGIVYELLIATISSYLLGDSVRQFSITIGLFMAAMGLGAYITKYLERELIAVFIGVEIAIALIGGLSGIILFIVYPHTIFYAPSMYGLIIIIGALVGMEIPILTRILCHERGLKHSIADVLSLDYTGALIGSISFPLLLLPFLGLFRASFLIGLTNAIIAVINIQLFRKNIKHSKTYWATAFSVIILLTAGFLTHYKISTFAESRLYSEQIIYKNRTKYQNIVVTRDEFTGKHRLFLDGHIQFAEVDEYRYHEALAHPIMSIEGKRAKVLILGGGDGMAAREILKYPNVQSIDLIDIDPDMTSLCASYPAIRKLNQNSLSNPKLTIHNVDAWQFVKNSDVLFDRIIIDLPDPHNEMLNKLYSIEFYKLLKQHMSPQGYLVTQSTSPLITKNTFWSIATTLEAAGMNTFSYQVTIPSFSGSWGFNIGSASGEVPSSYLVAEEKTKFLTSGVMDRAGIFAKDELPEQPIINSIFEPKLYLAYNKDVSNW